MADHSAVESGVLLTVQGIWGQVAGQNDRSPRNAVINSGLSRLVKEVMSEDRMSDSSTPSCIHALKSTGVCSEIRHFCQDCEYHMECYWARRLISADSL